MPLVGTPVARVEDARLLTAGGTYVEDLPLADACWVTYVTSPVAHARIRSIDTSAAEAASGILAVVTADALDLDPLPPLSPEIPAAMARPLLATDVVRFVGEPIVAVVARDRASAEDAAELVVVDVEPLPPLVDPDEARTGALLLHPAAGTNVGFHASGGSDPEAVAAALASAEVRVAHRFRSARVAPAPLEGRAGAATWDERGRLVHWSSCQGAHPTRDLLARVYGLDASQVRVIVPDVGGSFGAKARPYPEEILLGWLARRVGRPVRWVSARRDDMIGLGHARAQLQDVEIGGRADGTIEAIRVRILADAGAYPSIGSLLPRNSGVLLPGVYGIPLAHWEVESVATTTTPTVSYRGAGRPEGIAIVERAVDLFAAAAGLDPVEVRRRNLLRADAFPFTTATGLTYDSGDYARLLDTALEAVGYDELRAEQQARRARGTGPYLGIGVATFLDRTAGVPSAEYGAVELQPDGSLLVLTGSTPYGQGHETTWAMLVADRTGVPLDEIRVVHGDTDLIARSSVTGGSRSVQRAGVAVAQATDELVASARARAADLLEAAPADVVLDVAAGGRFHVAGTPARAVTWRDVASAGGAERDGPPLRCEADFTAASTFPSGAYVAVVEVDPETGQVRLRRFVAVDDAGVIVNPLLATGQVQGGVVQGIGQALFEEVVYDRDGNPLTTSLADYAMPTAAEIPWLETALVEVPSPNNPLGAKGIAESGTIGAPPAIQNAVVDALAHLGVTHVDLPCTPERVWRALRDAAPAQTP